MKIRKGMKVRISNGCAWRGGEVGKVILFDKMDGCWMVKFPDDETLSVTEIYLEKP